MYSRIHFRPILNTNVGHGMTTAQSPYLLDPSGNLCVIIRRLRLVLRFFTFHESEMH